MTRHAALNNLDHATLKIRRERKAELGDAVMAAPAYPHEFRNLQPHYPIVFSKQDNGLFRPVALFGFEEGSNLFLTDDGWDADYLPVSMQIQPFLLGMSAPESGEPQLQVHIDLDHPRVNEEEGDAVFLSHGGHSEYLQEMNGMLGMLHHAERALPHFSATLDELGLLEPFTLDITLKDGTKGRLAGFYTIAEEKLYNLDSDALGRLQATNMLLPIYMMVASVSQFRALIKRRNALVDAA